MPDEPTVLFGVDDGLGVLQLNRPSKLNAMNGRMAGEVHGVCERARAQGARALVVTGSTRAFSAGADLKDGSGSAPGRPGWVEAINALADLPIPTVAAIEGWCLGGGLLLAIACDLRVASRDARLGAPEILRGIYFGSTGTWRMPRIIGTARTKQLFFLGDEIDAETAERWGLVNWLAEPGGALDTAREIGGRLARGATVAIAASKKLVDGALDSDLAGGMEAEAREGAAVTASADSQEGVRAFVERRPPAFEGR